MQINQLSKLTEMAQADLGKLKKEQLKTNRGRLYLRVDDDWIEADVGLREQVDFEGVFEDTEIFESAYNQLEKVEELEEELEESPKLKAKLSPMINKGLEEFNKNIVKAPLNTKTIFEARFENIEIDLLSDLYKKLASSPKLKAKVKLHLTLSLGTLASYDKGQRLAQ